MDYQKDSIVDHILSEEQLNKLITEKFERIREFYGFTEKVDNKDNNVLES
jgi:hypothetical protein